MEGDQVIMLCWMSHRNCTYVLTVHQSSSLIHSAVSCYAVLPSALDVKQQLSNDVLLAREGW